MSNQQEFDATIEDRYFEDYVSGTVLEYGDVCLDAEQIIGFAREYDPQFLHTDPERAKDGPYGGLIASGWQTAAVMMRLLVDHYVSRNASLGSPGIDELRWVKPVRPGQVLRARVTILETRPSRSKPDRGLVRSRIELVDAAGETVFHCIGMNLLLRRAGSGQGQGQASAG